MELFVTIIDNWKLLDSVSDSLDPIWLNYSFQRTEDAQMLIPCLYMWMARDPFLFLFQTQITIRISLKLF